MFEPLLRLLARPYLVMYDLAMRLGPKWGPVALGYGPVLLGILAFVFKGQLLDPLMNSDTATITIFLVFALTGPLMHVGTRILTERMHRSHNGEWPASADPRLNRKGEISPTMLWVQTVREWAREG